MHGDADRLVVLNLDDKVHIGIKGAIRMVIINNVGMSIARRYISVDSTHTQAFLLHFHHITLIPPEARKRHPHDNS